MLPSPQKIYCIVKYLLCVYTYRALLVGCGLRAASWTTVP